MSRSREKTTFIKKAKSQGCENVANNLHSFNKVERLVEIVDPFYQKHLC